MRGVAGGVAGTAVMTAFQQLVEMPLTGRSASFVSADFAEEVTSLRAGSPRSRRRPNRVDHFALRTLWEAAHGIAAMRGQRAVNAVFGVVYVGDVGANTALGLYRPLQWSAKDVLVDVVDKDVQAPATGAVFDRVLAPGR